MKPSLDTAIAALLTDAISARTTPGGVVSIGTSQAAHCTVTAGRLTCADDAAAVAPDTIYDLASLTKVLATTPLALRAHVKGLAPLESRITRWLPMMSAHDVTPLDLLEHAAGLPAHRPYFRSVAGRAGYLAAIAAEPLAYEPRTTHVYTDLGFILLSIVLEVARSSTLDAQFAAFLDEACPGVALAFGVPPGQPGAVAPTGIDPWRGRVLVGQVHDSNAAALGGVAGHAGLFGTAEAVGALARWWLRRLKGDDVASAGVTSSLMQRAVTRGSVPASSRGLGWDTMLPTSSSGSRLSPRAFGHTGFSGTSLWIDPARDLYVVCLTNRVAISDDPVGIRRLRVALHDLVADHVPEIAP